MKCPNCGKWNRATLPHCVYCGQELPPDLYPMDNPPPWQGQVQDNPNNYARVDEDGEVEQADDPRDKLAKDMADLKTRKIKGEVKQRQLRRIAAEQGIAPSGRAVRTVGNRSTFYTSNEDVDASLRPVAPEMVEEGDIEPGARRVNPRYRTVYVNPEREENPSGRFDSEAVYDGYPESSSFNRDEYENMIRLRNMGNVSHKPRTHSVRRIFNALLIVCLLALAGWLAVSFVIPMIKANQTEELPKATVIPTIRDDLAAHTIAIPGTDGQRITIRELRMSTIVIGGVATFDIADHVWYDDYENFLEDTMSVTLSPYIISDSGKQQPLETISYTIDIPRSPIDMETPDSLYEVVSTTMYNIVFYVREGSAVTINGEDYSDLVAAENGKVSYNATVQPIGENTYDIVVRSQYCRENNLTITLYREKQSIPLDLQSDIANRVSDDTGTLMVRATTLPGAIVKVLSPYKDLDITKVNVDGSFSFYAVLDVIGNNKIIITADYPNRDTTRVEHIVYYVPSIDSYSRKAWDIVTQYTDLMDNMEIRKAKSQIYVCTGMIDAVDTVKPQRAFFNVGTAESPLLVYIENASRTTWLEGTSYRLYGDAYGMYDGKPWLIVRYTYGMNEY